MKKACVITICLSLLIATMASGMTHWYASKGTRGLDVYVEAEFDKTKTLNNDDCKKIGLKANKVIKSVTVRLKEGDYDKKKTGKKENKMVRLQKFNNPFSTSSASWKWSYEK